MRIIDLFDICNGETLNADIVLEHPNEDTILYLRPSNDILNAVSGYVNRENVKLNKIFPKNSIIVGTNGEGSHTYSYVIPFEFTANSDVAILLPKNLNMTLSEKLFYSKAISINRPLFSYGRKPKGKNLENIILPSIPNYVENYNISDIKTGNNTNKTPEISTNSWLPYKIDELFTVDLSKGDLKEQDCMENGSVPLVSSGCNKHGIIGYVQQEGDGVSQLFPKNTITVDMFGKAFYQYFDYYAVSHGRVNILHPKFDLNKYIGIFLCTLIDNEIYRVCYGRNVYSNALKNITIKLPSIKVTKDNHEPDWQYMEDYIKSLPYADLI